jgi:hypothetical protein
VEERTDDEMGESAMTETTTVRNGVDVDQLLATIEQLGQDPQVGRFTFRASSTWVDGTHSRGRIHGFEHAGGEDTSRAAAFELDGDEPLVLLGSDHGPSSVRCAPTSRRRHPSAT